MCWISRKPPSRCFCWRQRSFIQRGELRQVAPVTSQAKPGLRGSSWTAGVHFCWKLIPWLNSLRTSRGTSVQASRKFYKTRFQRKWRLSTEKVELLPLNCISYTNKNWISHSKILMRTNASLGCWANSALDTVVKMVCTKQLGSNKQHSFWSVFKESF